MARRRQIQKQNDDFEIEREFEERVEARRRRGLVREAREFPGAEARRDRKKTKPPFLLRFLAWCGIILFCFVMGYAGTGYMVEKLGWNDPWSPVPEGAVSGDAMTAGSGFASSEGFDIQTATFSVFYPKDGGLASEKIDVISRTLEDNIREAALYILKLSGMGDEVDVIHVFRDVDMVYLDLSGSFPAALSRVGAEFATFLINGVVRTMNENFSVTKVRFLVDSKIVSPSAASPVDLSAVWQIQR